MGDKEDIAAENHAFKQRFPFYVIGALALLVGAGLVAYTIDLWPWTIAAVIAGVAAIWVGGWRARR